MSEDSWPKLAASSGIAAAVFLILSYIFGPGDPPGFDESATSVQAYVLDNQNGIQAAIAFQFAAIAAFAWFLGSVFYRLRAAESSARLSAVALVGGVLVAVGGLVGSAAGAAASYHAGALGPDITLGLWDVSVFGYLFFLVGLAVLASAVGALAMRVGALPGGLGAYSLLLGLYAFVVGLIGTFSQGGAFSPSDGVFGLIAFLGFIVWLLAMGITLVREPRASAGTAPAQPAPAPPVP